MFTDFSYSALPKEIRPFGMARVDQDAGGKSCDECPYMEWDSASQSYHCPAGWTPPKHCMRFKDVRGNWWMITSDVEGEVEKAFDELTNRNIVPTAPLPQPQPPPFLADSS